MSRLLALALAVSLAAPLARAQVAVGDGDQLLDGLADADAARRREASLALMEGFLVHAPAIARRLAAAERQDPTVGARVERVWRNGAAHVTSAALAQRLPGGVRALHPRALAGLLGDAPALAAALDELAHSPLGDDPLLAPGIVECLVFAVHRLRVPALSGTVSVHATETALLERPWPAPARERLVLAARTWLADPSLASLALRVLAKHDPSALAALLRDARPSVRREALELLAPPLSSLALERCADEDATVRRAAVRVLGAGPPSAEVERALVLRLDDGHADVRRAAVDALVSLRAVGAALRLGRLLGEDPSARVRTATVAALAALPDPAAGDVLTGLLAHPGADVRAAALTVLGRWRDARRALACAACVDDVAEEVRVAALDAVAAIGTGVPSALVAPRLDDPCDRVRASAALALGRLGAADVAGRLLALEDASRIPPDVAAEALLALRPAELAAEVGRRLSLLLVHYEGPTAGCGLAMDALRKRTERVDALLTAAVAWADERCLRVVAEGALARPAHVQLRVHAALAARPTSAATRLLVERGPAALREEARRTAIVALTADPNPASLAALVQHLRRPGEVGLELHGAIHAFGRLPEEVAALLGDDRPTVRRFAVATLCATRDVRHLPRLLPLLADPEPSVRAAVVQDLRALPTDVHHGRLAALLGDPDAFVAWCALSTLQSLGAREHAPAIAAVLDQTRDSDLKIGAIHVLAELDAGFAAPAIARFLEVEGLAVAAAEALGTLRAVDAAPELVRIARAGSPELRAAALDALAAVGRAALVPDLEALLADPEPRVRASAVTALAAARGSACSGLVAARLDDDETWVRTAAAAALARLRGREHSDRIARLARRPGPGASSFESDCMVRALVRLDARRHMAVILDARNGWFTLVLDELSAVHAPATYARVAALPLRDPALIAPGTFADLLERLRARGVPIAFGADVPAAAGAEACGTLTLPAAGGGAVWVQRNAAPRGCVVAFDDDRGVVEVLTVAAARQRWLRWAIRPEAPR